MAEKGREREGERDAEREVDCGNFCRFATLAHVLAKLNTLQRELTTFSECVCAVMCAIIVCVCVYTCVRVHVCN